VKIKKIVAAAILICVVSAAETFAQAFLNTDRYIAAFSLKKGENISDNDYVWAAENEYYERFARLSGRSDLIDTNLEFALLSFYSPTVVKMRPAGANTQLPANNANNIRISGLKLGAVIYKELVETNFFNPGRTAALGRYEDMLQFISEQNSNITRQQIEQYYRSNIKSLITEILDEEFNKVSFSLNNLQEKRLYFITMIRNPQNGRYTLHYEVPSVTPVVKTITATARESLLNEIRKRTEEFSPSDIDIIRGQAATIPAVAFQAPVRADAVNVINAFYLNPNTDTYNALKTKWRDLFGQKEPGQAAAAAFSRVLFALCDAMEEIGQ